MAVIIDGKELAKKVKEKLKIDCINLKESGIIPKLAVISVGDDVASKIYLKNKSIVCNEIGIDFEEFIFDNNIQEIELLNKIEELNNDSSINGILVQSPVPKHINIHTLFEKISPSKDVDGFNPINIGKLSLNEDTFVPCTPYGIMKIFEEYNIPLEEKSVVIIGRSNIVGKPLVQCCLNKNATVTICHSKTKNLKEFTQLADIVIVAVGIPKFLESDMVKEKAVVIDVGINRSDAGKIVGDVDFEKVEKKASYITKVPGGVGPMTIAMLMNNVVKATHNQINN